ncbi:prepilin-type N-terminal cleavage/methylation domain-containing protein [Opitutaceae bacterium TAV1]|nr:prepilin-type N-terminal cleavage/methylation domain-containing protein [Opitutaceae bacterium TAV1]
MIPHSQRVFVCRRRSEAESPARASCEARRAAARFSAAFTLIELLCVIAIIGVLAAIVIATVGTVRQRAYAARTASNLRQLQMANIAYALEHGTYVPCYLNEGGNWPKNNTFRSYLGVNPYDSALDDYSIENYPLIMRTGFAKWMDKKYRTVGLNAVANQHESGNTAVKKPIPMSAIPRPSKMICFADSCDYQVTYTGRDNSTGPEWPYKGGGPLAYRAPGEKVIVVSFAGNVFYLTKAETTDRQRWYYNE